MSTLPIFGILVLDREPFGFKDLPGLFQVWLQDAGGYAALGLFFYLVYALTIPQQQSNSAKFRAGVSKWMLLMTVAAIATYSVYGVLVFSEVGFDQANYKPPVDPNSYVKYEPPVFSTAGQAITLMLAGLFSLLAISEPFVVSLSKMRFQRIYALTKLGYLEAIRSRTMLVFLAFLIPLLFPITWFLPFKPEDDLRITIDVTSKATQVLLFLTAALLASFAIPTDIKNQNLFTVVTKPVERIEIVMGRFFGYVALMTVALIGMTLVGWFFIYTTKIDDLAKAETYMARKPVRGSLSFASRRGEIEGTNVAREFDLRKYIAGDPASSQRAIWTFNSIPSSLKGNRESVPLEFTFDIFRMTKGEENRGVDLDIRIVTRNCPQSPPTEPRDGEWKWSDPQQRAEYEEAARQAVADLGQPGQNPAAILARAIPGTPAWDAVNKLAEEFGYYEVNGKEVFDYHPEYIEVPVGLFRNLDKSTKSGQQDQPPVTVYVKCTSPGQMLGMADSDLYFMENRPEPSDWMFAQNYFKASFGLWCRVTILIGIAVTFSTYLSGVISFLGATLLFFSSFTSEHLIDLASGRSFVGGPARSITNLLEAKQPTSQFDTSNPLAKVIQGADQVFSWVVRRILNLIPDLEAYTWNRFLAEGFNVSFEYLVMNFLMVIAYLLPWLILGFFLMRSREVAE